MKSFKVKEKKQYSAFSDNGTFLVEAEIDAGGHADWILKWRSTAIFKEMFAGGHVRYATPSGQLGALRELGTLCMEFAHKLIEERENRNGKDNGPAD